MNSTENSVSSSTASSTESGKVQSQRGGSSPLRETMAKAKQATTEVIGQTKEKVSEVADHQKTAAAKSIEGYGSALRDSARSLEPQDPNLAHYTNRAAESLEKAASYVREANFDQMRHDVEDVARRHPALFMGGLLVAGVVLGNLAKAAAQSLRDAESGREQSRDEEESYPENETSGSEEFAEAGIRDDGFGETPRTFDSGSEVRNQTVQEDIHP